MTLMSTHLDVREPQPGWGPLLRRRIDPLRPETDSESPEGDPGRASVTVGGRG